MMTNDVVVSANGKIFFEIDDIGMLEVFKLLNRMGMLKMDCPGCGLTILPQVRNYYNATRSNEFSVLCVGCGRSVLVRMYDDYGFILE